MLVGPKEAIGIALRRVGRCGRDRPEAHQGKRARGENLVEGAKELTSEHASHFLALYLAAGCEQGGGCRGPGHPKVLQALSFDVFH